MAERPKALGGADRTLFMLALVPYLLDRGEVTVDEVAQRFDVSPELVRKTVELLSVTGIPGSAGAYLDNDLFDIDWDALDRGVVVLTRNIVIDETPRLSAREAAALIAGLQYLSALPENADSDALAGLMAKLARGASRTPPAVSVQHVAPDGTLAVIREAIGSGTQLRFDYLNGRGESETRTVDPLRLDAEDQDWYLRAWCHSRQALRTFRLDRMTGTVATGVPATHGPGELKLPDTLFVPSADDVTVELSLPASALPLIADFGPQVVSDADAEGRVRATVRLAHHNGLRRLIASLGGIATVLAPAEARRAVADWARRGAARYEG